MLFPNPNFTLTTSTTTYHLGWTEVFRIHFYMYHPSFFAASNLIHVLSFPPG